MKKRKELTPEQTAARDARRSRFRELARKVAKMSDAERAALVSRMPAIVTVEGRALSGFNSCLIAFQNPAASLVGGFKQWLAHGRAVRKGEHGAMIWVPAGARAAGSEAPAADGGEGGDDSGPRFITGTVFSVEQTDELPTNETTSETTSPGAQENQAVESSANA